MKCEECGDRTKAMLQKHPTKPGKYVCELCREVEFSRCSKCGKIFHHPWIDSCNLDPLDAVCDDCMKQ